MPSGILHDRITYLCTPAVGLTTYGVLNWLRNRSSSSTETGFLAALTAGAFLFGGLWLSPDLDIYSDPFKRWGWLRWIWLPYQNNVVHRSWISHGPIIGTLLRLLYLGLWISLFALLLLALLRILGIDRKVLEFAKKLTPSMTEIFAIFVGLELSAISHIVADYL